MSFSTLPRDVRAAGACAQTSAAAARRSGETQDATDRERPLPTASLAHGRVSTRPAASRPYPLNRLSVGVAPQDPIFS